MFDNPSLLESVTESFRMRLIGGTVTFEMKAHYASEEAARLHVAPFLHGWEIDAALRYGPGALTFVFQSAQIEDRSSRSDESARVTRLTGAQPVFVATAPPPPRMLKDYPAPPANFLVSPDVETMWRRYEGYLAGREPLAGMAYMCLTVLEASADGQGKREKAARQYNIDREVLDNLGELTSEVGDPKTARKVPGRGGFRPHTEAEVAWMEAVVKALIRRAGEWAFDPNAARQKLTMADFPDLGTGKS